MFKCIYKLFWLIVLLILSSCSSLDLYHVQSSSQNFDYYQGKQILQDQNKDLTVHLNYEHQDGNFFVFYTYFENTGDSIVLITTSNLSMNTNSSLNIGALDPETEITQLTQNRKNLDESHSANTGLNCLFGSFDVITSIAEGNGEEAFEDAAYWAENMVIENEEYEFERNRIKEAKQFWQNETLRISNLYPGDEVGGLVYFPIDPNANSFTIKFDLGDEALNFSFKQIKQ